MKKIDEVIELFDNGCIRPCVECPCYGMKECQEQLAAESYYLHEYQKIEEEHAENIPLTWEELKQMEGEPVWIELLNHDIWEDPSHRVDSEWWVIGEVRKDDIILATYLDEMELCEEDIDVLWKAYRKERQNVQS